ncbi:MAG: CHAT domain-containing protein/predicted metalloenzyme YecM/tetratricopeptide (TPR) repeat protein [Saprospiraceae bacterium]|jgi:CHAT domain-containing protein/predicted metalloenzyme YecM/tetratricopeptide (TPR) repeat protein
MRAYLSILILFLPILTFCQKSESFAADISYSNSLEKKEGIEYLKSVIANSDTISADTLALLHHKIGVKYYQIQDFKNAIQNTIISKNIREKLFQEGSVKREKRLKSLSQSYGNLGAIYRVWQESSDNKKHIDSLNYFFKKVIHLGNSQDNDRYVTACSELGLQYAKNADYTKSEFYFNLGIQFFKNLDSLQLSQKSDLAKLYLEQANVFAAQKNNSEYQNSINKLKFAVEFLEEDEEYPMLAIAYDILGDLYQKSENPERAVNSYQQAIYWNEELIAADYQGKTEEWKLRLARVWNNIGDFYNIQKNHSKALDCFAKSLKIKEQLYGNDYHPSKSAYFGNVGDTHFQKGDYTKAAQFHHTAISHFLPDFETKTFSAQPNHTQLELCSRKVDLLYVLERKGEALTALKETGTALQTFTTADRLIDIMRKNHSESGSKLFWREKTRSLYEKALNIAYQKKDAKQAFYFFEKSKSVLLLDALNASEARQLLPDSLAEREMSLLQASDAAREAASVDRIQNPKYRQTNSDLEEFQKYLAEEYPKYYATRYEISVADLEEAGDLYSYQDETEYIHFFYGENHIYTMRFGVGKSKLTRTIRNAQTDTLIKKYLQQFSSPNIIVKNPEDYNKLAFRVYGLLLKPLFPNGQFPEELVLLPDDFLNVLPFDALKNQSGSTSNSDYLLQQTNIRYAYSINVLKNQQSIDNQNIKTLGMAPFAQSNDSLALNYSGEELKIAEKNGQGLFVKGDAATKDFFLINAPNFQFLHLSTHAREKGQNGNPEIFFANNEKLDLSKLYSTEFNTNLVILSACETGLGEVKKGEGVLSLNRGFTYAGAKSIISSLWRVNDKSTGDILSQFYANLDKKTTKSNALHLAKKDFLQNADAAFQSPYYWAGLTYSGSDGTVVLERNSFWKFLLLGGFGFLILGFLFWFFYKSRDKEKTLPSPLPFLRQLFAEMQEAKADFSDLTIDHICYRVETEKRYLELKKELAQYSKLLTEKPISGRPIATFKLEEPFIFQNQKIYLLELPAPKKGSFYTEGWEHIEMVIKPSFQDFMAKNAHLDFDTKAINKKVNPEVRLTFPSGAVKFHHYSLDYVIKYLD